MDFDWNEDQRAIQQAVTGLCEQHAGPARAIGLESKAAYDDVLDAALAEAGFDQVVLGPETGPLEAALVVETVARHAGTVAIGAGTLVAPVVTGRPLAGPVALVSLAAPGPSRFGAHARSALIDAGDEARLVTLAPGDAEAVRSNFMLPLGRIRVDERSGESLGAGSGALLRRWWRIALAAETLGAMQAALDITVEYVKRRRQFGRPIGSFQALQHRLAMCTVLVEGTRWMTFEAAAKGAPEEAAASAAAHAAGAANHLFRETHQLTGSMGFTREHDLHVFSMRLQALRLELGGASAHRRAIAASRWTAAT